MDLTVTDLRGNPQRLTVDSNATVGQLKQLIARDFGVNSSQQKLSNNDPPISLDDDSRTLSEYGVTSGSTIALLITNPGPMKVFVRNERGGTETYEVDPDETVDQLQRKIYNKERVPVDQKQLIFNGRQLESGRMLRDYGIINESTIHTTLRLRGGQ